MEFYDSPLAARLYDLQHEGDPILEAESDFLLQRIEDAGPRARVLELACGTGRILLPALANEADIYGLDRSPAFLQSLREKAHSEKLPAPCVWQADLAQPAATPHSWELLILAFRSFDHILDEAAQRDCLRAAAQLLRPDSGRLIVNTAAPHPDYLHSLQGQLFLMRDDLRDPATGHDVAWWAAAQYDPESELIHQAFLYEFRDKEGRIRDRYHFPFSMRHVSPSHFVRLVQDCGLRVLEQYGGFEGEPPGCDTGEAVWVLGRAGDGLSPAFR